MIRMILCDDQNNFLEHLQNEIISVLDRMNEKAKL